MAVPARRPVRSRRASRRPRHDARFSLRTTAEQAATIRAAAESKGVSVTDFVVGNAVVAAEQVLADRVHLTWSVEDFDRFMAILDRPASVHPSLRELLARPDPWDG